MQVGIRQDSQTIIILQKLTHRVASYFLRRVFRLHGKVSPELFQLQKGRYIIVANHIWKRDPYIIFAVLPYRIFTKLLPVRFFTANKYMSFWWQKIVLIPFGCFKAYSTEKELSGVKGAIRLSDIGQTLFIFPQGERVNTMKKISLKTGIAYLIKNRNYLILPVKINNSNSGTHIIWGTPFSLSTAIKAKSYDAITDIIFSKVKSL